MTLISRYGASLGVADGLALLLMTLAGLATVLGVLPVRFLRGVSPRGEGMTLGFTSGIMLAVVVLDLVPDALRTAGGDLLPAVLGLLLGVGLISGLAIGANRLPVPRGLRAANGGRSSLAFVLFVALAIHNAPEGLATGMGYAEGLTVSGHLVALAIGLQNIPEGFLVALPIFLETRSLRTAGVYAFFSGAIEPTAGILALLFLSLSPGLLSGAYALASGGMIAAALSQTLPRSLKQARPLRSAASVGLGLGLIVLVHAALAGFTAGT